ncbi:hypothetical protein SAXI111661_15630 [Saccharomonospora xinjiangensis]|uniref:hypothetical protein n=1 Tax=Saccharomonospora xinjiangensis TaxID=75294 RepID=UPI0010C53EFC|nr:hypothetical protein [Saccharomonospora xinjiangensis]QBQ61326.1 hypothetical protein EYD13_14890 [Saccharomonospora xinjiangensis]
MSQDDGRYPGLPLAGVRNCPEGLREIGIDGAAAAITSAVRLAADARVRDLPVTDDTVSGPNPTVCEE